MRASTERMCRRVDGKISFQLTTSRRRSRYQQARTTDAADSRLQRSPDPLDAPPVRLRSSRDLCHPRLDHLGRTFLTESSPGVIGGCETRTQYRAAERGQAVECFILIRVLETRREATGQRPPASRTECFDLYQIGHFSRIELTSFRRRRRRSAGAATTTAAFGEVVSLELMAPSHARTLLLGGAFGDRLRQGEHTARFTAGQAIYEPPARSMVDRDN